MSWGTAVSNAKTSLNKHVRPIVEGKVSTALAVVISYLVAQWQVTTYPCVRVTFLTRGTFNSQRNCLQIMLQLDVMTNQRQDSLADLIMGKVLEELGFDLENTVQECGVPHKDWKGDGAELLEMDLELIEGPETGPEDDAEVTHLWCRFNLYFRQ